MQFVSEIYLLPGTNSLLAKSVRLTKMLNVSFRAGMSVCGVYSFARSTILFKRLSPETSMTRPRMASLSLKKLLIPLTRQLVLL